MSTNSKLELPDLRVGTLDMLMALSDDLVKVSASLDGISAKIRRTLADLGASQGQPMLVEGKPVGDYVTHFKWDEAKFPSRRPLKETIDKAVAIMAKVEDELKASCATPCRCNPAVYQGTQASWVMPRLGIA